MPENTDTVVLHDNDATLDGESSIHDIYKAIQDEEGAPTEDKDTKDPSPTAEEGPDEPEVEVDSDEDDLDLPKLDAKALEAIGDNPKAKEAWERAWKGVTKREKQLTGKEEALKALGIDPDTDQAEVKEFKFLRDGLSNPATAAKTALGIIKFLTDSGITFPEGTPGTTQAPALEFSEEGYAKGGDKAVLEAAVAQAKAQAKKEIMDELGFNPEEVKALLSNQKQQTAEAIKTKEVDDYVSGVTPRIAAKAEKTLGWSGVDKAMVGQAYRTFPELTKTDPMTALKQTFPDKWAEVFSKSASRGNQKVVVDGREGGGIEIPKDPMAYNIHHAYAQISD